MKRNKALKAIRKVLKDWEGSQLDNNECADEVLSALEDLGMLPPKIEDELWMCRPSIETVYTINEWEE